MKKARNHAPVLQPRFRVVCGKNVALGPGKAELLEHIDETGSLGKAALRMGMSYMRAWMLVRTMNECFRQPIIVTARGGPEHGGASLTPAGHAALQLYRQMEEQSRTVVQPAWTQLQELLKA